MASSPGLAADGSPCTRCKDPVAPHTLRNSPTCRNCYVDYVDTKAGRRLGVLARDTRTSARPAPRRYLAGLSFGPSSTAMTNVLDASAKFHSSRKASPAFEPLAVHVDTNLTRTRPAAQHTAAHELLAKYRQRFPNVTFEYVHLTQVLGVRSIDWALLLGADDKSHLDRIDADQDHLGSCRLQAFLDSLPSASSRADMMRLLVRNLLLDMALDRSYSAVLFGHTTTALASLALSEVASGRGFTIPWQINDGPCRVSLSAQPPALPNGDEPQLAEMPVYYPLREILRYEIMLYLDLVPSLRHLVPAEPPSTSVVSHKDLSIGDVVSRYFDGVEGPYSGIVTNVVRTTGKLDRETGPDACPVCGMGIDEQGDSRWAGSLGGDRGDETTPGSWFKLCYGCRRTLGG